MENKYQTRRLGVLKRAVLATAVALGAGYLPQSCITINVDIPVYVDGIHLGEVSPEALNDAGGLEGLTNALSDILPKE